MLAPGAKDLPQFEDCNILVGYEKTSCRINSGNKPNKEKCIMERWNEQKIQAVLKIGVEWFSFNFKCELTYTSKFLK